MNAASHTRPASARPRPAERNSGAWINRALDGLADPDRDYFGIHASPYLVFGLCGVALGFAVTAGLAIRISFPVSALAALLVVALATFVATGLIRKAIVKRDCHVLLDDVLCVLLTTGAAGRAAGLPFWTTLDLVTVGTGVFLILGRLGCLAGGCCHGRPSGLGVCYEAGKVNDLLVGIRLFPMQLVEAAWLAALVPAAAGLLITGAPPGSAMWFWLLAYAAVRFPAGVRTRRPAAPLGSANRTAVDMSLDSGLAHSSRAGRAAPHPRRRRRGLGRRGIPGPAALAITSRPPLPLTCSRRYFTSTVASDVAPLASRTST